MWIPFFECASNRCEENTQLHPVHRARDLEARCSLFSHQYVYEEDKNEPGVWHAFNVMYTGNGCSADAEQSRRKMEVHTCRSLDWYGHQIASEAAKAVHEKALKAGESEESALAQAAAEEKLLKPPPVPCFPHAQTLCTCNKRTALTLAGQATGLKGEAGCIEHSFCHFGRLYELSWGTKETHDDFP